MSQDEPEDGDDAERSEHGRDASEETVEDVDHEHPTTGDTFDQTGVHGRGKEHPQATTNDDAEPEATDEGDEDLESEASEQADDEAESDASEGSEEDAESDANGGSDDDSGDADGS